MFMLYKCSYFVQIFNGNASQQLIEIEEYDFSTSTFLNATSVFSYSGGIPRFFW